MTDEQKMARDAMIGELFPDPSKVDDQAIEDLVLNLTKSRFELYETWQKNEGTTEGYAAFMEIQEFDRKLDALDPDWRSK